MSTESTLSVPAPRRSSVRARSQPTRRRPRGVTVGRLAGIDEQGNALVQFKGSRGGKPVVARSVTPLKPADVGREAVLAFERGNRRKPLVVGLIHDPKTETALANVVVDGQSLQLSAANEIVLRCGRASITLTRAGKVLIRGAYLLSRSSGANRIKGGSVQIN